MINRPSTTHFVYYFSMAKSPTTPLEKPRSNAGRKPQASLRRLTPEVFDFLAHGVIQMRSALRVEGARLHLVEGLRMSEASRQSGLPANALENARKMIADKDDLLRPHYGRKT